MTNPADALNLSREAEERGLHTFELGEDEVTLGTVLESEDSEILLVVQSVDGSVPATWEEPAILVVSMPDGYRCGALMDRTDWAVEALQEKDFIRELLTEVAAQRDAAESGEGVDPAGIDTRLAKWGVSTLVAEASE
ncbi:hypothetical protein QQM79_11990 [Marinobacteraceae bacterium S3BR75-40.1]